LSATSRLADNQQVKLLRQFGERMLVWTIIVLLGAVVLIILDLLGYG
jgi:hypothetical protein